MASINHALLLAAPILGKVVAFSIPTTCTALDLNTSLGTGAMSAGGYIDIIFTGDCYFAWGTSVASSVTSGGASAGMYAPAFARLTLEPPSTSGWQYIIASAVTGTAYAYAYKSSFADNEQYRHYIAGQRTNAL